MSNKLAALKGRVLILSVACALLSGMTMAKAQGLRDDPPGAAFQNQGIDDDNGMEPGEHWSGGNWYGAESPARAHASARGARAAAQREYGYQSPNFGAQWSSSKADHAGQCWYREGGGGQDLSGSWGPCASH